MQKLAEISKALVVIVAAIVLRGAEAFGLAPDAITPELANTLATGLVGVAVAVWAVPNKAPTIPVKGKVE